MANVPKRVSLEPGETVQEAWVAGIPSRSGRRAAWGGTLVVTDRRLVFEPLNVPVTAGDVPIGEIGPEHRMVCPLSDLDGVDADPEHRALLRLRARSGEEARFLVAAGRMTPVWSKKNEQARDAAVEVIAQAIRRAAGEQRR